MKNYKLHYIKHLTSIRKVKKYNKGQKNFLTLKFVNTKIPKSQIFRKIVLKNISVKNTKNIVLKNTKNIVLKKYKKYCLKKVLKNRVKKYQC